jgi:FkbM family methyltransferase
MYLNSWKVIDDDQGLKTKFADSSRGFLWYGESIVTEAVKFLDNKRTAIDCGAHYGFVSFWLQKHFDQIQSFEVVPEIAECLKFNMDLYNCNKVVVHNCGVSDTDQDVDVKKTWDLKFTSLSSFISPGGTHNTIPSHTATIDSFNFKDVDFIKLDVEGYEQKAIRGALGTIDQYSPVIAFEERRMEQKDHRFYNQLYSQFRYNETKTVMDLLEPLGYNIVQIQTASHGYKRDIIAKRTR